MLQTIFVLCAVVFVAALSGLHLVLTLTSQNWLRNALAKASTVPVAVMWLAGVALFVHNRTFEAHPVVVGLAIVVIVGSMSLVKACDIAFDITPKPQTDKGKRREA